MINKKKSSLSKRYQKSYETKNSVSGGSIMQFDGVEFFAPKVGKNRINIIPYTIKTKNHPLVCKGEFEIGDKDYVMDIFVHRNIGPGQANIVCLKNNFGKPCPICEQAEQFKKEGKEDEAKALSPSRRVFYNIQDLNEPDKVKVFETSHYLFEKELIDEARDDEEGGFIDFADPEEGKEIRFKCFEEQLGNIKYKKFKSFTFENREDSISEEILENAISFDEILKVPTYSEAEKILYGNVSDSNDEEEEKPKKSDKRKIEDDEENEDDDSDNEEENEEIEDEEEEPKKSKESNNKCPFNHKFGKDCDNFDDCDKCGDVWNECFKKGE